MSKFKIGDRVICAYPYYIDIEKYEILTVSNTNIDFIQFLEKGNNITDWYPIDNFELVSRPRPYADLIKQWADDDSLILEAFCPNAGYPIEGFEGMWADSFDKALKGKKLRIKPNEPTKKELALQKVIDAKRALAEAEELLNKME